jgi:aminopeptidase N
MFGKIAAFELRYQLRSPVFLVVAAIFFLLTFGATASDQIQIGGGGGNIHKNAAYTIVQTHLILSLFYMFVTTAFVANVIVRDDDTGFAGIVRATRISKADYLYGRFLGAFTAAAISFLAVPLAMVLGAAMPWLDPEKIGAFAPAHYLYAYFVMALPLLLLTSSLFFLLATVTRSMMLTYVGVVAVIVGYFIFMVVVGKPELEAVAAWFDPLGMGAVDLATKYWTAAERNDALPALTGPLLANRIGVLIASAVFLLATWATFRFDSTPQSGRTPRRAKAAPTASAPPPALVAPRAGIQRFDARGVAAQFAARTRLDMRQVFLSPAYFVLLGLGLFNSMVSLWFTVEQAAYGGALHPVTRAVIPVLQGTFSLIPVIVAIYYAGELVWRERERKTHEIVDAAPAPDWVFVAPKIMAIALVLISTVLVSVVAGLIVQSAHGYFDFELGKYLLWYVLPSAVDCTLLAVLAVFLQTISPHKFVGWALMVIYIVATISLDNLGFGHNLYLYGGVPQVPLSDLNGQGDFWVGAWTFRLYWAFVALLLGVLSHLLWRRGTETRLTPRLLRAPFRLAGGTGMVLGAAVLGSAALGVFIFINTNVWNDYRSNIDDEKWQADLERTLLPFESIPQPKIVSAKLEVDIHPKDPSLDTHGLYVIENKTAQNLREVHLRFDRDLDVLALSVQGAWPKQSFERFNYRIFVFDAPMRPGERRTIAFATRRAQKGFKNSGGDVRVVGNGTFVNDREIAPSLGMSRDGLLVDRAKRRKYGLPSELRMAKLGTPGADQFNGLRRDSDFVASDITVTTDADQTPIAPGTRVSDRVDGDRRIARFVAEAPIMHFFSIQSARYARRSETYKGVALTVYHHPAHAWNVERMMQSMKLSLDYFQAAFSPYQFHQVRFIEFPDYADFAQSFANTIPWSEGLGFIVDTREEDGGKIDFITYVGAHEIAHQWWGHQLVGADEQGGALLVETLAQYSALRVMKHRYGEPMIRKFLKYELDRYLRRRGGEALGELPIIRVEDQPYIYYQKGSLVMYRLAEEIGEEAVNRALRRMLAAHAFKGAPYPTSLDLLAALRAEAPADKQALITDLFEKITLYDLKARDPKVVRRPDGRYDVSFTVLAKKLYADEKGVETEAPLAETIEIGAFAAEPGKKGFDASKVQVVEKRQIRSGTQVIRLVTAAAPRFVGVDPYNTLIDRNGDDNLARVD